MSPALAWFIGTVGMTTWASRDDVFNGKDILAILMQLVMVCILLALQDRADRRRQIGD